jgi:hypothetical protein
MSVYPSGYDLESTICFASLEYCYNYVYFTILYLQSLQTAGQFSAIQPGLDVQSPFNAKLAQFGLRLTQD